jgi:hypothetical protein
VNSIGVSAFGQAPTAGPIETELRNSIAHYEIGWQRRDFKSVWELMSARLKAGNSNSRKKFESFVRRSGYCPHRIKVSEIRIDRGVAYVTAEVEYHTLAGKSLGSEVERSKWTLQDGQWRYDGFERVKDE